MTGFLPENPGVIKMDTIAEIRRLHFVENKKIQRFVELVQEKFKTLHAGNAIRFGLRPLEFSNWYDSYKLG
ncbi:MAG: hypothetical protein ABL925_18090 [Methylococcales bacterium]